MIEAQDYNSPQPIVAGDSTRVATDDLQQPQDCTSLQTGGPMNRVSISDQPGLHNLRALRSTKWTLK